ncbi:MAG TPA: hypothetical protein VES97_08685 [Solirubrobacteraceae bacterium]|nr:hypothetical protein [Solirubrobacteraceae bacterium]
MSRLRRAPASAARRLLVGLAALLACAMLAPAGAPAFDFSFIGSLHTVSPVGSTVPANGDLNPYGIATVPSTVGSLVRGDLLISNFNDAENLQGTGTTLVQVAPGGSQSLFARIDPSTLPGPCPGGVGLTTALAMLPGGYVVVGSLPTSDGTAATAQAGCLIVLSPTGHVVRTISGPPINGPWDMTAVSFGPITELFVTNVLNGTVAKGETVTSGGTVVRIGLFSPDHRPPFVLSEQVIATGFPERTDPAALVVGPTGVGLGFGGILYVADTQGNRIAAIPNALFRQTPSGGGGLTVAAGGSLSNPLGLTLAPNGHILTANANDGDLVETTPFGKELTAFDTGAGAGGLFGLTVAPGGKGLYFVNDAENTLDLLH